MEDTYITMKRDRRVKEATADTATKFWVAVGELETEYKVISQLALTLLLIPHSNAIAERIFSMINHNLTDSRKCLSKDKTLNNSMIIKLADLADDFQPSEALKRKAKSATFSMLNA